MESWFFLVKTPQFSYFVHMLSSFVFYKCFPFSHEFSHDFLGRDANAGLESRHARHAFSAGGQYLDETDPVVAAQEVGP